MQYVDLVLFIPMFFIMLSGACLLCSVGHYVVKTVLFAIICNFVITIIFFCKGIMSSGEYVHTILEWLPLISMSADWSVHLDKLSLLMLLVVYTVALVVFIYSIGYVENADERARFFWLLLIFIFFMTLLVVSGNLLQLFCGWEGVGLSSYLLIGFNRNSNNAANASIKAFIMNRIGDVCFILAIVLVYNVFGTLNFNLIAADIIDKDFNILHWIGFKVNILDIICCLIFIACMAKSAQIGLHTWLPDAMAGPTPVSALIHSATMVASGVFLVVRCSFLFKSSVIASLLIMVVGSATALSFAIVALRENDLKRIIAYSTCSQLGYMMMACGAYDYAGAMFHLVTNAFAKSLLFLSAGIVIKITGMRDIRSMSGIWNTHKLVCIFFWTSSLSLIGIFPFAGYFSKEHLLLSVYYYSKFGILFFFVGMVAAFFTALYLLRVVFKIFYGSNNQLDNNKHLVDCLMSFSPIALVCMLLVSPMLDLIGLTDGSYFSGILSLVNAKQSTTSVVKILPIFTGILGILMAYIMFYKNKFFILGSTDVSSGKVSRFISMDRIYNFFIVLRFKNLSFFAANIIDLKFLDCIFSKLVSWLFNFCAMLVNLLHLGRLNYYLFTMFIGMVLLALLFL
ncbi:NADH-quinone oxidoreductase subunit L [Candidatus Xenohaliotis californiensis]|uniref:NADH-quinone oxidoreductase subunit L n=1 Tax=Candidatus Xenohaliotis californiensis TaxID=84677 RepID=A0ABP0EWP3_9RICK|nr:NADH-quinone oxidoreductase subunit L [Candidatus Xenohaliotis californiensis]